MTDIFSASWIPHHAQLTSTRPFDCPFLCWTESSSEPVEAAHPSAVDVGNFVSGMRKMTKAGIN